LDFQRISSSFSDYEIVKWIIIESNSDDNSAFILKEYSRKEKVIYSESIKSPDKYFPHRTQKLAHARNRYLEIFDGLNKKNEIKFLVVCDLNNLNNKLNLEAVRSCNDIIGWGALTANQNGPYYDIWALRHKYWNETDCWERYTEIAKFYSNKNLALWDSVYSKMIKIQREAPPIKVDSAFGGLAIYHTKFLKNCNYKGENKIGDQTCEHVPFHKSFTKNGGSIYINPALINLKLTDHSRRKKYFFLFNLKYKINQWFQ
jgi:hypothetical protein